MLQVLNSLLPIALLVLLGAALLRLRFFDEAFRRGLDRLVYWVALPALIVRVLVDAPTGEVLESVGGMLIALGGATVAVAGIAGVVAKAIRLPADEAGVFTQATFRGNLAFVGLPVLALATSHHADSSSLLAKAALVFAPTMVLFNLLSVFVLIAAQHRFDKTLPWTMAKSLGLNPLLLACAVGLAIWRLDIAIPEAATTTLDLVGRTAAPLALMALGGALVSYPVGRKIDTAGLAALLKCAALPAAAWLIASWVDLSDEDRRTVLVFAACPTAVASYVLATQLKGNPALAAAVIVVSTLLSGAGLAVVLAVS